MSQLSVTTIKSLTVSTPPVIQDSAGTQIGTFCRAWVNFNGTGTVAIRAAFNVSSISDLGLGDYTINFTNAMADANYSSVLTSNYGSAINPATAPTNTSVRVSGFTTTTGGGSDREYYSAAIFR